jgi:hypothetical protein
MNRPVDPRRRAVRIALERQFGRAITITPAMIDAVLAELDDEQSDDE